MESQPLYGCTCHGESFWVWKAIAYLCTNVSYGPQAVWHCKRSNRGSEGPSHLVEPLRLSCPLGG
jgi:hypothetical protein